MINFLDTCYLLNNLDNLEGSFMISSITLGELESIKTSKNKDFSIKEKANKATKFIKDNYDRIKIMNFKQDYLNLFPGWEINNDLKIVATAIAVSSTAEVIFYTDDISCLNIARHCNLTIGSSEIKKDYKGYKEVKMSNEEMADFYSHLDENIFGLYVNEYFIIRDLQSNCVDVRCWTGTTHRELKTHSFHSDYFGEIKAIKDDIYQKIAVDSLINNQMTMINGPAGSGKSMLSLAYLMSQLENGKIDKIIIFANPAASRNSVRLGFTPGDLISKILDTQVGSMLIGKFGDRLEVERLVNDGKIVLMSFSNLRGFDTSGMNAGIYISEAQNLDRELIKLAIQRVGEDCIMIIEGDNEQVDDNVYAEDNNGMRRVSEVFKGQDFYGQIKLNNVHRSKMAMIAEQI